MKRIYITLGLLLALGFQSCEKLLETDQVGSVSKEEAVQSAEDLQAMLNGAYDVFANTFSGRSQIFNELLSDNLTKPNSSEFYTEVWNRKTNFFNSDVGTYFLDAYRAVDRVNVLVESFDEVDDLSNEDRVRMTAEAQFIRAYVHFDIVRQFAYPYGYTSDNSHPGIVIRSESSNLPLPRNTVGEVYAFCVEQLVTAIPNLPESNDIYASKDAAKALLAKVYFQMGDYQNALVYLDEVINSGRYQLIEGVERFAQDTVHSEWIFGIKSYIGEGITDYRSGALSGNYRDGGPQLRINKEEFFVEYFPNGLTGTDNREYWFEVLNPGLPNEIIRLKKFDYDFFDVPILYLTDLKLMRAEALGILGTDLNTAINDINDIVERANSTQTIPPGSDATTIVNRARFERRLETVGEGIWTGELKRMGAVEKLPIKILDYDYDCPGQILQFPISEDTPDFDMNEEGGC